MKDYTCNVCGVALEGENNAFRRLLKWEIPDSPKVKYKKRTLRAQVEVKFHVTASSSILDDVDEDTDICDTCIKKYLPEGLTR